MNLPKFRIDKVYDMMSLSEVIDYGSAMIGAPKAWLKSNGAGIRVGIIDTGTPTHEDLQSSMAVQHHGVKAEGLGVDTEGHGTHVAGIIGARANGSGVIGVAPACRLYCYKAVPGSWTDLERAFKAMVRWRVDVLNLSFGSNSQPPAVIVDLIHDLHNRGTIIVAAAGNDFQAGINSVDWPARMNEWVIPVAAIDRNNVAATFSSEGDELVEGYAMPGVEILSTWLNNGYARLSGTSMAAPFLSGVIALILSKHLSDQGDTPIPTFGNTRLKQVKDHLDFLCTSLGDPHRLGHGFINLENL